MVETKAPSCNGVHANFLTHRNCANGNLGPAAHGLCHPPGFARQLNSGLLAKSEGANVLVKAVFSKAQSDLDGAHVARIGQNFRNREKTIGFVITNPQSIDHDGSVLAIENFVRVA